MDFLTWMKHVDTGLILAVGMDSHYFPDQTWFDWWEAGMKPRDAVGEVVNSECLGRDRELEELMHEYRTEGMWE